MPEPLSDAFLARLWALLNDPDAIARLARHPRRLRLPRRPGLLLSRTIPHCPG